MNLTKVDKASQGIENAYVKTLTQAYKDTYQNINNELQSLYARYSVDGKLSLEIMSVKDRNKVTRLTKLIDKINLELNSLNRGMPQEMAGYLTNQWLKNYEMTADAVTDLTGLSFDVIPREQVYQSALSDLGKIGLESNAQTVKINLKRAITQSIVKGDSIQTMANVVQSALEVNANNAVRIARTETTRVMSEARMSMFKDAEDLGINMEKKWIAAQDSRTRHTHATLDGQQVKMDKLFKSESGAGLMYPGDQSAGASETVNCRCTIVSILTDYE